MANGRFEITRLSGGPIEGIWKPAKKGAKRFQAAKIKNGQVPAVLQVPHGWAPDKGMATARELEVGQVAVVSEDKKDFAELFDSVEEFEAAGYKFA